MSTERQRHEAEGMQARSLRRRRIVVEFLCGECLAVWHHVEPIGTRRADGRPRCPKCTAPPALCGDFVLC